MDNIALQIEEQEVLLSIFGDQWHKSPEVENSYHIELDKNTELWVTLNDFYPSEKPPSYDLLAPNLTKAEKLLVDTEFKEIYESNKGEPIIFQWIEKLKDIMESHKNNSRVDDAETELINNIEELQLSTNISKEIEINNSSQLNVIHGSTITDRKSTFQGHVCKVINSTQVREFMDVLLENKKIAQATHNILAYRIETPNKLLLQDCDDDGETHAGGRLLHLLEILDLKNVAVVVTRWYGGIHLGPDRFKHINNAGRVALVEAGFIQ